MSPPRPVPDPPDDPLDRAVAFAAFYELTYPDVLRFVQRRVHPSHAEDVVADTFLVTWRRFDDVPAEPGAARPWVFGVARHVLLTTRRGIERRRALAVRILEVDALGGAAATTPAGDDLVASRVDLARAWVLLSAVHQEALALAVLDDLSGAEAAQVLGISPVAFRLRLTRARRALRAVLASVPPPPTANRPSHFVSPSSPSSERSR